jgi:muramoyltetrapeptide carboxypeptidase
VRPGDRVGVAALSGPVDAAALDRGLVELRRLGWEPVLAGNLASRRGLFAGGDSERLEAFHRLAADPSLAAIFFARGGHGLLRLLPRLDWDLLAARPRAYVGYSDATPFLLEVVARLGLVAFHGPMVATDLGRGLDAAEAESLRGALAGEAIPPLPLPRWLQGEAAEGILLGGCLSLLAATLGTPFAPALDGALLFWEDVGEPLYRLDRMLTHLRLSGSLAGIRGMVVGASIGPGGPEGAGASTVSAAVPDAGTDFMAELAEVVSEIPAPVAWGLQSGHRRPNFTLPLGLRARMDPRERRLLFP